jgi:hypothetical protein
MDLTQRRPERYLCDKQRADDCDNAWATIIQGISIKVFALHNTSGVKHQKPLAQKAKHPYNTARKYNISNAGVAKW